MEKLLIGAEKYVTDLLRSELSHNFLYHNLGHSQRVVKYTQELIQESSLSKKEQQQLLLAAWFHDLGHIEGSDNHEEHSVRMAQEFLEKQKADASDIANVSGLIRATKMGYTPVTLQEKIIKDADCGHFKSKKFTAISDLLRAEWELDKDRVCSDVEWTQENISFFTDKHRYYTDYAISNWQKGKDRNLMALLKTLKKQKNEAKKEQIKAEEFALKKTKATMPERGIETMFRVTLRNHITLSDIADTKANILLSVNAIIVSLVLSNLVSKLDNKSNDHLIWPTVIFVLFTVASMILSVLATRPNVTSGKFSKEDVANKKVNLLFFGNFHKMSLPDFEWAMGEMMKDRDYLYSSMKKDLYFLGKVLDRKYKILRLTYSVFIIGIVVSVLAFAIAFKFYGSV